MNPEKVFFGFFIVMALSLNFGFFLGEMDNPDHHDVYELAAAIFVNVFATILKLGDRSQVGAVLLATSLAADLQLLVAALIWTIAMHVEQTGLTSSVMASIVSLSGGALVANIVSVVQLVVDTATLRR